MSRSVRPGSSSNRSPSVAVADAIEPEVAEAGAHLAPGRERPGLAPEEQRRAGARSRSDSSPFSFAYFTCSRRCATSASRATASPAAERAPLLRRRHEQPRVGEQRLELLRQHAGHLAEDRLARARERRIAELRDDPRAEHERLNLFSVEHQRRQIVAGLQAVADAGLAVDRRPGLRSDRGCRGRPSAPKSPACPRSAPP